MFWGVRFGSLALVAAGLIALNFATAGVSDFTQRLIALAGLYVTLSVSLNLINGITGQFSIGHAAFYQIGAYTTAYISYLYFKPQDMNSWLWLALMIVAGTIAAAIAGVVVGLPSLRLRGDYLAIVTLGFGEIVRILSINIGLKKPGATESVGESYGLNVVPTFKYAWLIWLLAIICIAVCRNLLKTAHGLPFLAVREDEVASSAMGVNTPKVKLTAFIIGSAFAGAAGVLYAHMNGFVNADMFRMDVSFIILTMVVLGGTGSITGSALAAAALFYVPEWMRTLKNPDGSPATVSGAALVAVIVATFLAISALKKIQDSYHGPTIKKVGISVGAIAAALILNFILRAIFQDVAALSSAQYRVEQLRMVMFAGTLIVLMLLRPQGVFAHHEFNWNWVKRLLRLRTREATAS